MVGRRKWEKLGVVMGREIINRIYCMKKCVLIKSDMDLSGISKT